MLKPVLIGWTGLALATLIGCGAKDDQSVVAPDNAAPAFVDRNGNGELDVYEDETQSRQARVADLMSKLTLEQKSLW